MEGETMKDKDFIYDVITLMRKLGKENTGFGRGKSSQGAGLMGNKLWGPAWVQRREVKDRKQAKTTIVTIMTLITNRLRRMAKKTAKPQLNRYTYKGEILWRKLPGT